MRYPNGIHFHNWLSFQRRKSFGVITKYLMKSIENRVVPISEKSIISLVVVRFFAATMRLDYLSEIM